MNLSWKVSKQSEVVPVHTMKSYGKAEAQLHAFLTSVLDGGQYSAPCPGPYINGEQPWLPTEQKAGWVQNWHRCFKKTEISTPASCSLYNCPYTR